MHVHHEETSFAAHGSARHGRVAGAAAAGFDGAGADAACARRRRRRKTRLACIEMVHGAAGSTGEGTEQALLVAGEGRRAISNSARRLEPLEPFRDYITIVSDTDLHPATAWAAAEEGADHFRSSAVYLTAAHPKMTEGSDYFVGTSHRSDLRAAVRPGHAAALDPALHRDGGRLGRLRLRLCLRVRRHHQLGVADAAAADDARSAHGVRESVRRRRHAGRARRAAEGESQHSRLDLARCGAAAKGSGRRATAAGSTQYLDDVREIERRIQRIEKYNASGEARALPAAPLGVPDSYEEHVQADVRSAGAGLHDRHHARLGVQDEPRRQRPRVARRAA